MGKSGAFYAPNLSRMRRIVIIVGTLGAALAVILATGAYRTAEDGSAGGATTLAAATPAEPPLVLGGQAGDLAVGLTARRSQGGGLDLATTVLGQDGTPVDGLDVTFAAPDRQHTSGEACGAGCYATGLPLEGATTVSIEIAGKPAVEFAIPASWKPAKELVVRLTQTYRDLETVAYSERLESRPGTAIETSWKMAAPDRIAYAIAGGASGIAIGDRRWDRQPGEEWVESAQDPLRLPEAPWGDRIESASLLGSARLGGRPTWVVSFAAGLGTPTWFTVWVDKETSRPLEVKMTTAAHFMTQRYTSFDTRFAIEPPS